MMLSFMVFVFVGTVWNQSNGLDTPDIQFELTRAACEAARTQWLADHAAANESETPTFRVGYGATPCQMIISEAGSKSS